MENKIYLDSGVMITLGILHNYCSNKLKRNGDYSQVGSIIENNKRELRELLQKDVNILDFDINSIFDLYTGIMSEEINACVPPFVFKEIAMDTSRGALTKEFFKNCYLAMPKKDEDFLAMPVKTISLDKDLIKVEVSDRADPSIVYGLNPDSHSKTDKDAVDVNIEDRCILSQVNYLAEIGDKNLKFIKGSEIFYPSSAEKMTPVGEECKKNVQYIYDETLEAERNFDKKEEELKELLSVETPITQVKAKENVLFLHQNEKDYGRKYNGVKRNRTFALSNEHSQRDVMAMDEVTKKLQEIATNTNIVTFDNKKLQAFLENTKAYSMGC